MHVDWHGASSKVKGEDNKIMPKVKKGEIGTPL